MRIAIASIVLALVALPAGAREALPIEQQIGSGGRPVGANWSRSPVFAKHGMAATAHPLATQIALDILKKGGSAVDAAIAANAALGLMEPTGNGIGGDLFAIIYDPKTAKLYGINGSGRSPRGQTLADLQGSGPIIRLCKETEHERPLLADGRADGAASAVFSQEPRQTTG